MRDPTPILELVGVLPHKRANRLPATLFDLRVGPGECVVIEARDRALASEFADLCCGLGGSHGGRVCFLGRDWAGASNEYVAAMRGRIGRTYGPSGWIEFYGTDVNILASQLHHTRRPVHELREAAAALAQHFGLPGLPLARPGVLPASDLVRADCVRAFLGEPRLVIVDGSEVEQIADLRLALLSALTAVQSRRSAAIWLTGSDEIWRDRTLPTTKRLHLTDRGLAPSRERS